VSFSAALSVLHIYKTGLSSGVVFTALHSQIGKSQQEFDDAADYKSTFTTDKSRGTILWTKIRKQI